LLIHNCNPVALFRDTTDVSLLFGDVWADDSAPVDLDRRVDDFRAINAISLREQIASDLKSGRKFSYFFRII